MESQPKERRERGHHTHVRNNREWVGLLTFLFLFVFFSPALLKLLTPLLLLLLPSKIMTSSFTGMMVGGGFSVVGTSDTPAQKLAPLFFCADSGKFTIS